MCVPSSNSLPRDTVPPGRFSEAALCCNQEVSFSIQKTTRHWLLCRAHFSITARLEIVLEAGRVLPCLATTPADAATVADLRMIPYM